LLWDLAESLLIPITLIFRASNFAMFC